MFTCKYYPFRIWKHFKYIITVHIHRYFMLHEYLCTSFQKCPLNCNCVLKYGFGFPVYSLLCDVH